MIVNKSMFFENPSRGASMTEVILAMAIVAVVAPFLYGQISDTSASIRDMAYARNIIATRDVAMNYVRINQSDWPPQAQIRLSEDELAEISESAVAGFIDKYSVRGATVTDVYLAFDTATAIDAARIARYVGGDAAVVSDDKIAYGTNWAVSAPDFMPGQLIYRASRDTSGIDTSKYLHRASSDDDALNMMMRNLNMGGNSIFNVGTVIAKSARLRSASAVFADAQTVDARTVYFPRGANIDGAGVAFGGMRVTGDIAGFRNINADNMNGNTYTTNGRIVTDRATVKKSVNVARDFVIKSSSLRTISGFTGISANSVKTPYVSAEEIIFYDNFGLTLSGELLMSTTAPLKLGSWTFPSTSNPKFNNLTFDRAKIPTAPSRDEFRAIKSREWKSVLPKDRLP